MNQECLYVQAGFRKGRRTRDKIANDHWIIGKRREFQKTIYLCFVDYTKAFDCVDHNKLWKILQEMGISEHLLCFLRNMYVGQEATVRTGHGTIDWLKTGIGVMSKLIGHFAYLASMKSQFSSITQSCLTLCDPMNRSMPGLPIHHQLPEFTQTHAHRVGDAIQPSPPLSSPSPPAPNPSQHQGLFQ